MSNHINTREAAAILNCHPETVLKYARQGKVNTVPDHPLFPIRSQKLFYKEEIHALQKEQQVNGYTVSDIAKKLNVTTAMVHFYIKQDRLKAEKKHYGANGRYIISEDDFQEFLDRENGPVQKANKYYDNNKDIYLYQPYMQTGTQELARINKITKSDISLRTQNGKSMSLDMAITENYKPLQQLSNLPYFQKKGQLLFDFPYSTDINHRIFDVIDWLMKHMGHKNMQIEQKESRIHLQLRSAFISTSNHIDFAEILDEHCLSGSIHLLPDGIYLKSEYQYITSYVHEDIKEWIVEQAKKNNQTQSKFVEECLVRLKNEDG